MVGMFLVVGGVFVGRENVAISMEIVIVIARYSMVVDDSGGGDGRRMSKTS